MCLYWWSRHIWVFDAILRLEVGYNTGTRGSCPSLQLNRETDRTTEGTKRRNLMGQKEEEGM